MIYCVEFRIAYAGQEPFKMWVCGVQAPTKLVAINRATKQNKQLYDDAQEVKYLRCITMEEYNAMGQAEKAND